MVAKAPRRMIQGKQADMRKHPSKPNIIAVFLFVCAALPIDASPWRLVSQTWRNLVGGGVVFSPYNYDQRGLRVQRRDYNSKDTSGVLVSRTEWEYDAQDRSVREIAFTETDTATIVTRVWDGALLRVESTWGKRGILRYRDTFTYGTDGQKLSCRRISPADSTISVHTWTYDPAGNLGKDTVWQPDAGSLVAVLATETHWLGATVTWTQEWSRTVGSSRWNPLQRTELEWTNGTLVSTTDLEGDGTGRILSDSTVYAYDPAGNRVKETAFGNERSASTEITYAWVSTGATRISRFGRAASDLKTTGNLLRLEAKDDPLEVVLVDSRGRMAVRYEVLSARIWEIPTSLPEGRYLALARFADRQSTCPVTKLR